MYTCDITAVIPTVILTANRPLPPPCPVGSAPRPGTAGGGTGGGGSGFAYDSPQKQQQQYPAGGGSAARSPYRPPAAGHRMPADSVQALQELRDA